MNKKLLLLTLVIVAISGYSLMSSRRTESGESTDKSSKVTTTQKQKPKMTFFITSRNPGKGADFGGLSGADSYCAELATAAGSAGKTWRAYLSQVATAGEPAVNARDRIGSGPWYNYEGTVIAKDIDELHSVNGLNKATALTESGKIVNGRGDKPNEHDILTGSNADGTVSAGDGADTTCSNWTSGGAGSAILGHHDRVGINETAAMKSWNSSHASYGCDMASLRATGGAGLIYCFASN